MTNDQYINQLYISVIGRAPDSQGKTWWINSLTAGLFTRQSVVAAFVAAPEVQTAIRGNVTMAYHMVLGRTPDAAGMAWWMNELSNGSTIPSLDAIQNRFRQSQEYIDNGSQDRNIMHNDAQTDRIIIEPGTDGGTNDNPTSTPTSQAGQQPSAADQLAEQQAAFTRANSRANVQMILDRYGLGGMMGWVDSMLVNNAPQAQILIEMQDQPDFTRRFPALAMQRSNQMPVMSPEEYLNYETLARQKMRAAGLPDGFYDDPSDFTNLIANGVSQVELGERIQSVYLRVINAPDEVKARYAQMFGVQGEGALAAQMLDPDLAFPILEQQVATAEIAGFGDVFGTNIDQQRAGRLADIGFDGRSSMQGFRQIAAQGSVFDESISESNDLTAENEGVDAAFGLDQDSADTIERRRATRVGSLSGGGGLMVDQTGIAGRADR